VGLDAATWVAPPRHLVGGVGGMIPEAVRVFARSTTTCVVATIDVSHAIGPWRKKRLSPTVFATIQQHCDKSTTDGTAL